MRGPHRRGDVCPGRRYQIQPLELRPVPPENDDNRLKKLDPIIQTK